MSYYSQTIKEMSVKIEGVEIKVVNVTYYPPVRATEIDPPEGSFIEYESLFIGGVDVTNLVQNVSDMLCEAIEDKIIQQIEV